MSKSETLELKHISNPHRIFKRVTIIVVKDLRKTILKYALPLNKCLQCKKKTENYINPQYSLE